MHSSDFYSFVSSQLHKGTLKCVKLNMERVGNLIMVFCFLNDNLKTNYSNKTIKKPTKKIGHQSSEARAPRPEWGGQPGERRGRA